MTFFFGHGVNTKVGDIGLVYLNMENEQNLMKQTRETGQKPHFGPDLGHVLISNYANYAKMRCF